MLCPGVEGRTCNPHIFFRGADHGTLKMSLAPTPWYPWFARASSATGLNIAASCIAIRHRCVGGHHCVVPNPNRWKKNEKDFQGAPSITGSLKPAEYNHEAWKKRVNHRKSGNVVSIGKLLDMIGKEKQFQKTIGCSIRLRARCQMLWFPVSSWGRVSSPEKSVFQNEDPGKSWMKGKERFIVFIHHQPLRGWGPGRHDQDGIMIFS